MCFAKDTRSNKRKGLRTWKVQNGLKPALRQRFNVGGGAKSL